MRIRLSILLFAAFHFLSCKENEIYPDIPAIEFQDYSFTRDPLTNETLLKLSLTYKDGDGDIGLDSRDTFPPYNVVRTDSSDNINPYHNNLFANYYEQVNGGWQRLTNPANGDTVKFEYRISNITPEGKHRAIRGAIELQIAPSLYDTRTDTIMLDMWIVDRALHQSNVVRTPVIVLPR